MLLMSCDGKVPTIAGGVSGPEGLTAEGHLLLNLMISYARKFKNELREIINFGAESEWFGRINLIVGMNGAEVFDFYRFEMPNFGWKEITSIRSDISLITYQRGGRIANVRIDSTSKRSTEVWVTVSPKDAGSNISQ